jgi:CBS domain-containing protein
MSPRAAWRLQALGCVEVYDYVTGKADWLAAGLPTEGTRDGPRRVAEVMDRSPLTCAPAEPVAEVLSRLMPSGAGLCVVVNDLAVVLGRVRLDRVDPADGRAIEEVMEPGPATVRADADLAETTDRMKQRSVTSLIVSTPDGVLLGVLYP